ncbi:MAG: hypothetical protein HRT86_03620 [Ilumatobacteraceae bacterium]|nr:hypothetical protein [Ilumatobacteraceae bacterium]
MSSGSASIVSVVSEPTSSDGGSTAPPVAVAHRIAVCSSPIPALGSRR